MVRGRSREIGIRTALGAATSDVLRMVVVEGMKPALLGIAVGAAGALASARLMTTVAGLSSSYFRHLTDAQKRAAVVEICDFLCVTRLVVGASGSRCRCAPSRRRA